MSGPIGNINYNKAGHKQDFGMGKNEVPTDLIDRMKKLAQSKKGETQREAQQTSDESKKQVRALRKDNEKLETKAKVEEKQRKVAEEELARVKEELRQTKTQLYDQGTLEKAVQARTVELQQEINRLNGEVNQRDLKLDELKRRDIEGQLMDLQSRYDRSVTRNQRLQQANIMLGTRNRELEAKTKLDGSLFRNEAEDKIKQLQATISSMSNEMKTYRSKCEYYERHLTIPGMIQLLKNSVSPLTIGQFDGSSGFNSLVKRVEEIRAGKLFVDLPPTNTQPTQQVAVMTTPVEQEAQFIFGHIVYMDDEVKLKDLNGQLYVVDDLLFETPEHTAVKAKLNEDGSAHVVHYYGSESVTSSTPYRKVLRIKRDREKEVFEYYGNFTVLIVGSRNQRHYTDRLQAHGVNVEWHNPFEGSNEELRGKYSRADIVLFCRQHNKHLTWDVLNPDDPKVKVLDRDNKVIISETTKFMAIKLGLMKENGQEVAN